jgi:hypothetical protein
MLQDRRCNERCMVNSAQLTYGGTFNRLLLEQFRAIPYAPVPPWNIPMRAW